MPEYHIEGRAGIVEAIRYKRKVTQDEGITHFPTNRVQIAYKGAIKDEFNLGVFGTYQAEQYIPDPRRCLRCQSYTHHTNNCTAAKVICGWCAGNHDRHQCLSKPICDRPPSKCVHCTDATHASSWSGCPFMKSIKANRLNKNTPNKNTKTQNTPPTQPEASNASTSTAQARETTGNPNTSTNPTTSHHNSTPAKPNNTNPNVNHNQNEHTKQTQNGQNEHTEQTPNTQNDQNEHTEQTQNTQNGTQDNTQQTQNTQTNTQEHVKRTQDELTPMQIIKALIELFLPIAEYYLNKNQATEGPWMFLVPGIKGILKLIR